MFVGREHEAGIIKRAIRSDRAELGIMYGRRRVGKSALLLELQRKRGDIYFEGLQRASQKDQIDHFLGQLAEQTGTPKAVANGWREAFEVLTFYLKTGKRYVVFDEFPWMASGRTELVSLVKYYWDNHWKKNPRLTLVLCGSIAQFMLKHIVHSQALHNRKTFEMKLEPLPAHEAALFFKNYRSQFEIAQFLMVFGGIPKYLEQIDPRRSLADNLDELCFRKDAFFLTEFETIFKEQFKVTRTYEAIVQELAQKSCSKEVLAKRLKMRPGGGMTSYIDNLEHADFVRAHSPLSVTAKGSKTRRIVLWDEWLRFCFSYVRPNAAAIQLNTEPGLFGDLVSRSFDTWCGLAFEQFCMKNLPSILASLRVRPNQILGYGPFFRQPKRNDQKDEGLQIDILVHRKGNVLMLFECKFRTRPIGVQVIREVERKIRFLGAPRKYTIERVLISAGDVTSKLEREAYFHHIIGLDSVFAPPK